MSAEPIIHTLTPSGIFRPQPVMSGYSGVVRGFYQNLNLPAGSSNIDGGTVPATEVWEIENIAISYTGTITNVILRVMIQAAGTLIFEQRGLTSTQYYDRQTKITLAPGENLRLTILNATLNDDAYLLYNARKFPIA